ncbi:Uncharacterized membrane protein YdcZ, DUF606 family [Dethiosulfatibacter aminovorans DSM 17477]|uniref:Uncharacterized membrane protein YdcZ, DUF606 family n=1 Tax=Dethiosulfatibacter aminovorans DSM 17477 TaxID=1121476 RepID=A0A1M6EI03_9FIRM|nr:DMT family transporter [Dethiosulfatibacter aminovorans]SHI85049.1 Uncharacterized membrane protein YdcZ, DUF606 family [Dethiosulfatibacter aminovorans DSM 17477]
MYYILAVIMGVMIVVSPVLNGQLTLKVGTYKTSLLNFGIGTVVALAVLMVFGSESVSPVIVHVPPYKYLGFFFGLFVILIYNHISSRLPAIYLVLLPFMGQTIMSTIVDYFIFDSFNFRKLIGVLLVFTGVWFNERK